MGLWTGPKTFTFPETLKSDERGGMILPVVLATILPDNHLIATMSEIDQMKFKYGVSNNCIIGNNGDYVGSYDATSSIDWVSNKDLDAVLAYMVKPENDGVIEMQVSPNHEIIGMETDVGGPVVAVLVDPVTDEVVCVVVENPTCVPFEI